MAFQSTKFSQIGVGGPSPYPATEDGATVDIGPKGLTLVTSMSFPTKAEIRAIRRGDLDVALMMVGSTAVLRSIRALLFKS